MSVSSHRTSRSTRCKQAAAAVHRDRGAGATARQHEATRLQRRGVVHRPRLRVPPRDDHVRCGRWVLVGRLPLSGGRGGTHYPLAGKLPRR